MKKTKKCFFNFEVVNPFRQITDSKQMIKIFNSKFLILLAVLGNILSIQAQQKYSINVSTSRYSSISQPAATDALDVQHLIDEFTKYAKIYKKSVCSETLDPQISMNLKAEMRKINEGTPYLLAVDYENCKFISLLPDKGTGGISSKGNTIYRIKLYQEIPSPSSLIPTEKTENSKSKKPILATFQDDSGKWIAMGPYMTTDPFSTEILAIGSLFYADSDISFLCQRGKFKIYALNVKVEHDARDIRSALKVFGINDIP